ncbi:MAG: LysM peptidoglycan-binding domain-containing protein [Polyangiales bacterium]
MKLVGWTSMVAVLIAGTAIAQGGEEQQTAKATVRVPSDVPNSHTVKEGDTLWDITQTYYGDPYRWPQVWSYNPEITNPHWIYPDATVQLRPGDGSAVDTAPSGFKRTRYRPSTAHAVYQAEYGFLDENVLEDAGYIIGAKEEQMMMVDTDVLYVRFDKGVEPEIGRLYTVFRTIEKSERESWERGTLVRLLGEIRLDDYDEQRQLGHAVVVNSLEGLERGFRLAPMERNFYWVDVVPAERSLRATVVASLYPRKLPSTNQIVFVNVGKEEGIVLGNRFYVVRRGDEWRRSSEGSIGREIETTVPLPDEPKQYPWEVIAIGRAVNVQPHTTAILLERATRAVRMGDRAELRQGE